jgi:hypothetical protein
MGGGSEDLPVEKRNEVSFGTCLDLARAHAKASWGKSIVKPVGTSKTTFLATVSLIVF